MFRIFPYILLFLTAALSQILFFDNITITPLLCPLVYIIFIALLPIETSQILMLGLGVALGVTMDWIMGVAGINTIATIFIAFNRIYILKFLCGKERTSEKGVPSELKLGAGDFIRYLSYMVIFHHIIYFAFDSLNLANITFSLSRFTLSSAVSLLFVWLLSRLFTLNNFLK